MQFTGILSNKAEENPGFFFKLNVKLSNTVHLLVLPAWPICGFSSLTIILSNMVMMQIFLTGIESSFAIVMVLLFLGIVKIRLVGCSCSLIFFSALSCWLLKSLAMKI